MLTWNGTKWAPAAATGGSVAVSAPLASSGGASPTLSLPAAASGVDGYLKGADWVAFTAKGTVSSIATSGPLTGGPIAGTGTLGINKATASADGYLAATDFTSFATTTTWGNHALGGYLKADGSVTASDALNLGGHAITNLSTPANASDAATKAYVDNMTGGLVWRASVTNLTASDPGAAGNSGNRFVDLTNWSGLGLNNIVLSNGSTWSLAGTSTTKDAVFASVPANGYVFNGTNWVQFSSGTTYTFGSSFVNNSNTITLAADGVASTHLATGAVTAAKIAAMGATSGQVLSYNGTQWAPSSAAAGTVTKVTAGTGLTGGDITSTGTLALANTSVSAGTYGRANVTVNAQGQITAASNGSSIDLASEVTGVLPLTQGGTGTNSQAGAANAILPAQASNSGKVLTTDGSNASWSSAPATQWTTTGTTIGYATGPVGVGTTSPNANAELEVSSTTKGFLLPRVALVATNNPAPMSAHVAGMMVFNTATVNDVAPGFYFNSGSFWTKAVSTAVLPIISTTAAGSITQNTASSGGNVSADGGASVTAYGVCWNTSTNPTISNAKTNEGSGLGTFASSLTGLSVATQYYYRAYATNSVGTAYGPQATFTTLPNVPTVSATTAASTIGDTTATSGGTISSNGSGTITAEGVCYATTTSPTISNGLAAAVSIAQSGAFTANLTGLTPGTFYYLRAYATNAGGTTYGAQVTFTTLTIPTVTSAATSSVTSTTASSGGTLSANGGTTIAANGICWSTTSGPTVALSTKTSNTVGSSWISAMTGLTPGTTYYVRAYATNSVGTGYGTESSFTSLAMPTLTTTATSAIAATSATSGGTITATGGATVTAAGVCWGTSSAPTTGNSTAAGSANSGTFTASLTGLTPGTLYYVRAYATNSVGTTYGAEVSFTALPVVPTLSTTVLSSITATSATSGGSISATGGASITANGLCWSTSTSPTIADTKTTDGLVQAGSFTSSLTGLTEGLVYYVRAYATNAAGTAYGSELSFTAENSLTFTYTGAQQTFTVPTGVTLVTIECWGASGGDGFTAGGKGGYAKGVKTVTAGSNIYVNVGGQGSSGGGDGVQLTVSGGWNGGGSGYSDSGNKWGKIGGGGGASDVRPDVIGYSYTQTSHTPFIVAGGVAAEPLIAASQALHSTKRPIPGVMEVETPVAMFP